jgi:N-acetyl-anhydromuramyl-L-alanine amidase AmpD
MSFERPARPVDKVYLHCSASDNPAHDDIEVIRDWHVNSNGWNDVGYHYFIRKSGRVETGRNLEHTPAAQGGHNRGTIAICLHGLKVDQFSVKQFRALSKLCRDINTAYDHQLTFHGHCEVSNKTCPVFDYRTVLGLDSDGLMVRAPDTGRPKAEPRETSYPILRTTSSGPAVAHLQQLLKNNGHKIAVDGEFGRETVEAVRKFQQKNKLVVDGIVGALTWAALNCS